MPACVHFMNDCVHAADVRNREYQKRKLGKDSWSIINDSARQSRPFTFIKAPHYG